MDTNEIMCPFCGDNDFDKPGLIYHIRLHCDAADAAWEAFVSYDAAEKLGQASA